MIGTGPFTLGEFKVGDKCVLKRVTKTKDGKDFKYWGGKVYLDEIAYYNFDGDNQLSAFASGDVAHPLRFHRRADGSGEVAAGRHPRHSHGAEHLLSHAGRPKAVLGQAGAPGDHDVGRQFQGREPRLRRRRRCRREPSRGAGPPRLCAAAAAQARRRRREEASEGGGLRERARGDDRRRQHRRAVAPDRLRGDARPIEGGWHQLKRQRDAGRQILGDLGQDAVRLHRLDASSARHDGDVAWLSHRRAVERDRAMPIRSSTRRSTRRRRRSTSRRARSSSRSRQKILQDDSGDGDADLAAGLHDRGQERERLPGASDASIISSTRSG